MRTSAFGAAAVLSACAALAACGGHPALARSTAAPVSPPAVSASPADSAADCAALASSFPPAAYDALVTAQVSKLARRGPVTAAQVRAARAHVAAAVAAGCPQFFYLAAQDEG
ncbi:MAG TPA: hypothetical protein VNF47_24140 [Streptosporangiaceae bacterium]|nr:hypothetical protein [Streptosporangiaceae bacterium]